VFDNRGSGRTRPMDDYASINDMAADCLLLLDHLDIDAVHILGHSMGGFIAQELALLQQERVLSLTLAATACRNSPRNNTLFADWAATRTTANQDQWLRGIFYWLFTDRFFEDAQNVAAAVAAAVDYQYPQSSTAFANQVMALTAFDRSSDLSKLNHPTLIMSGCEDILFPPVTAATLMRLLSVPRQATIRSAAHSIHLEQPEAFCRAVVTFLDEISSTNI
jgi:pimeloyl-ACP methyl ester carboxylesterase